MNKVRGFSKGFRRVGSLLENGERVQAAVTSRLMIIIIIIIIIPISRLSRELASGQRYLS